MIQMIIQVVQEQCQKSDATHLETLEEDYWEKASKDGNRVSHYRTGQANGVGSCLMVLAVAYRCLIKE